MVSWSISGAAGSLPARVCLPAPVVGVKPGNDVLCTGGKSLIKVG